SRKSQDYHIRQRFFRARRLNRRSHRPVFGPEAGVLSTFGPNVSDLGQNPASNNRNFACPYRSIDATFTARADFFIFSVILSQYIVGAAFSGLRQARTHELLPRNLPFLPPRQASRRPPDRGHRPHSGSRRRGVLATFKFPMRIYSILPSFLYPTRHTGLTELSEIKCAIAH